MMATAAELSNAGTLSCSKKQPDLHFKLIEADLNSRLKGSINEQLLLSLVLHAQSCSACAGLADHCMLELDKFGSGLKGSSYDDRTATAASSATFPSRFMLVGA